jgi:hypothetical protein
VNETLDIWLVTGFRKGCSENDDESVGTKAGEFPSQLSDNEILEVSVVWGQLELLGQLSTNN